MNLPQVFLAVSFFVVSMSSFAVELASLQLNSIESRGDTFVGNPNFDASLRSSGVRANVNNAITMKNECGITQINRLKSDGSTYVGQVSMTNSNKKCD